MDLKLQDRVVLITGGAGSIGSATARIFAENGAIVYINDLQKEAGEKLENTMREMGYRFHFLAGNVNCEEDIRTFVETAFEREGHIDCLVNNTGKSVEADKRAPICGLEERLWDRSMNICLNGIRNCCRYAVPHMKEQHFGRIVNIGSVAGFRQPLRNQDGYAISKAIIHHLTRDMALDYAPFGITANCVIPGSVVNANLGSLYSSEKSARAMKSHVPYGSPGKGAFIGEAVVFLCSPLSEFITGLLMNVDGGWSAGYAIEVNSDEEG